MPGSSQRSLGSGLSPAGGVHSELEIVLRGKSTEERKSGNQEGTNSAVEHKC